LAYRYKGALPYILEQDWTTGFKLINKTLEENDKEQQWDLYKSMYPNFTKDNFVPFSEFYKKPGRVVAVKTKEQIKADVQRDREKYGWNK